jgi:hypothetical protein
MRQPAERVERLARQQHVRHVGQRWEGGPDVANVVRERYFGSSVSLEAAEEARVRGWDLELPLATGGERGIWQPALVGLIA